ncbi:hypothetical protein NDU88_005201 [Pleurodeles waltl]|uniref:Uncharacterized protein n=1 Tax=Pleurodeles waltl TaxID=8319 RepID=A0AAV7WCN9_PLEWA|nr:hypothetical protein NDU88_005201 [Pleurodeles waltl]
MWPRATGERRASRRVLVMEERFPRYTLQSPQRDALWVVSVQRELLMLNGRVPADTLKISGRHQIRAKSVCFFF